MTSKISSAEYQADSVCRTLVKYLNLITIIALLPIVFHRFGVSIN